MADMSGTGNAFRPARNRTPVATYNLKILHDRAHDVHTYMIHKQAHHNIDKPRPVPVCTNEITSKTAASSQIIHSSFSSPLTFLSASPQMTPLRSRSLDSTVTLHQAHDPPQKTVLKSSVTTNNMAEFECFNSLIDSRGHYYSAPALYACGVWVGFLSPDKQKLQYRGLPSFNELKMNFADMSLPCPPSSEGASANNRSAICRGCFGEHSPLLTLREVQFVNNRVSLICACIADGLISNRNL
jgi:hypothetical protein